MATSDFDLDPSVRSTGNKVPIARALDPYGLDSDPQRALAELVSDLVHLIATAECHGLRPARAARWRSKLLTAAYPSDLLTRYEQHLRAWLLRRVERTPADD
jgi:hypothetical protein